MNARRDWFATALAPVLWGTMPSVATEALAPGHPLLIATTRSLVAGLGILLVCRQFPPKAWHLRILVLGTINIALTFGLFFVSASRVPGGIIAILMALSPFWAALWSWPLLGQRLRPARLLLIASGVAGIVLLAGASAVRLDAVGIIAGLGASSCMGCGIVLFKKWGRPASLVVFTGWQLLVGGILLAIFTLAAEGLPESLTFKGAAGLAYLVLASTVLAYVLWFRGIERLGAQPTSMLLLLVPVVALLIDAFLLGKLLTLLQGVGVLIVFACLSLEAVVMTGASATATAGRLRRILAARLKL